MADFTLVAGIKTKIEASQVRSELDNALAEINKKPIQIKVEFDKSSIEAMRSQIRDIMSGSGLKSNAFSDIKTATKEAETNVRQLSSAYSQTGQIARTTSQEINTANRSTIASYSQQLNLIYQIQRYLKANSRIANKPLGNQLNGILTELQSGKRLSTKELNDYAAGFRLLRTEVNKAGLAGKSFGDIMGSGIKKFSSWLGVSQLVMLAVRGVKQMVKTVTELDSALTQMQIVTKATNSEMEAFGDNAAKVAQKVASSITDIIDSATTYARLGYNMSESTQLAEYTAMLKNVGDIDVSDAQNAITAIIKAYGIGAENLESIMDKLVEVGNNFPISVSQIAEGMNNASSTLAASGNSFEQSVALLTAANTTIQNAAKSSTGLRTIAARIRNTKTDLEELGEDMTSANYEELVNSLTDAGVKLRTVNGEYRSTYDILSDIAQQWDKMSSSEQAAMATALSGTRQQAVFYSIIEQFKEASGAMDSMSKSTGALDEAYSTYMDSVQARKDQLKATFQTLSQDIFNSDALADSISALNTILKLLDKLINTFGALPIAAATTGLGLFIKNFD